MIIKQVLHDIPTNSVEATWVTRTVAPDVDVPEVPEVLDDEGNVVTPAVPAHTEPGAVTEVQARCHSYADVQMDMLEADLGADAKDYADLIALVRAGIKPYIPPPPVIPSVITMRQARLALLQAGKLSEVNAAISQAGEAAQIEWEFATEVHRAWPLVAALQSGLGLTDDDLDALFKLGETL